MKSTQLKSRWMNTNPTSLSVDEDLLIDERGRFNFVELALGSTKGVQRGHRLIRTGYLFGHLDQFYEIKHAICKDERPNQLFFLASQILQSSSCDAKTLFIGGETENVERETFRASRNRFENVGFVTLGTNPLPRKRDEFRIGSMSPYTVKFFNENKAATLFDLRQYACTVDHLHLSIDMNIMHPKCFACSSSGTRGELKTRDLYYLIKTLREFNNIRCLNITNINLRCAHDDHQVHRDSFLLSEVVSLALL